MALVFDEKMESLDEGVWTDFLGSRFKIAHTGNVKFQRALQKLQAPHRRKIEKGQLDPLESKLIICKAMSEGLVLDWEKVIDKKGNGVPFSKDSCYTALSNWDDLREYIQEFAMDLQNFKIENLEDEGNA